MTEAVPSPPRSEDSYWLDEATKTIGQFWKRKNARRHGLVAEKLTDVAPVYSLAPCNKSSQKFEEASGK
jgi:hypothetical protein